MLIAVVDATHAAGQEIVKKALRRGHAVTALHPEPREADLPERVRIVRGRATDGGAISDTIEGADAVVLCQEAPPARGPTTRTNATQHTLAAMVDHDVQRLVVLGDAVAPSPREAGDQWREAIGGVLGRLDIKEVEDVVKMTQLVENSERAWTVVRVQGLVEGPVQDVDEVARFVLDAVEERRHLHKAPIVGA